jgi:hypothetical protein
MNDGKQILGGYGDIPIYIHYGPYDPYYAWFDKNNYAEIYIIKNNISLNEI